MNVNVNDYTGLFQALLPELSLVIGALAVLGVDLALAKNRPLDERLRTSATIGSLAILAAAYHTVTSRAAGPVFGGVLVIDTLATVTRLGVLMLTLLTLGLLPGGRTLRHPAEFVSVLLFATVGFMLMASAQQLLVAFLAIELASLSLYILAGFDKTRAESAEASLKYFLFGGMAAAFLLFGFSLIYGLTGSLDFAVIAAQLHVGTPSPLLVVAFVMVLVAFGFKAAAAPFHLWAPDVYEGAPSSAAALIASASKLAGVVVFTRLLWHGFGPASGQFVATFTHSGWLTSLAVIAGASLLVGNLAALAQSNVRRLLAYSAIGHAGNMLLGVMVAGRVGPGALFYYATTYGLATVGAFAVIGVVDRADADAGGCRKITDLAGLHRRAPLLTGCLMVFVLSLAGVPPLAGFFGKFAVFAAALSVGGAGSAIGVLALAAIALSAVALYYYLVILKQAAVVAPAPDKAAKIEVPLDVGFVLVATALLLVVLGLFPSAILQVF